MHCKNSLSYDEDKYQAEPDGIGCLQTFISQNFLHLFMSTKKC